MRFLLLMVPAMAVHLRGKTTFSILTNVSPILVQTYNSTQAGHYGDPLARECKSDEANVTINGFPGSVCAPGCTMNSCPLDMPKSVNATPTCNIINWDTGLMYCSLACNTNNSCGHNATCKAVEGAFLCTYNK